MPSRDPILFPKYVVAFADANGDVISNKKLQKLLYYAQAWHLVVFDDHLFDEVPQAWVHGPAYPSVYRYFKKFGYEPISIQDEYRARDLDDDAEKLAAQLRNELGLPEDQIRQVNELLVKYGSLSPYQLEILSHSERPWSEIRKGLGPLDNSELEIPYELTKAYYGSLLANVK